MCGMIDRHKTGYGGYGPPKGWLRGARVILLREGQNTALSETWIRLEDGSVLHQAPSPHTPCDWQAMGVWHR